MAAGGRGRRYTVRTGSAGLRRRGRGMPPEPSRERAMLSKAACKARGAHPIYKTPHVTGPLSAPASQAPSSAQVEAVLLSGLAWLKQQLDRRPRRWLQLPGQHPARPHACKLISSPEGWLRSSGEGVSHSFACQGSDRKPFVGGRVYGCLPFLPSRRVRVFLVCGRVF